MVLFQFGVDAEAGDGYRCAAAVAIRVVGEFARRLVVDDAVISVFRFRPFHHLFCTQAAFLQAGEDVVIKLDAVAFGSIEVEQGVDRAVERAAEDKGVSACAAFQGVVATSAFDLVVARAAVNVVVAVKAEEVVGRAVALDGVVTRAAFRALYLCAVADEGLSGGRVAAVIQRQVFGFAAGVDPAAGGEVDVEVQRLFAGIKGVLPAAVVDVDVVTDGIFVKPFEAVGVITAVVVGVDAVGVVQRGQVVDAEFDGRERDFR